MSSVRLSESPHGHTVPSVIIGIADNEARENEEEVYSQISMIKYCRDRASCSIDIEMMIAQHYEAATPRSPSRIS